MSTRTNQGDAASGKGQKKGKAESAPRERERDIGHALRSVYQRTVDEDVPRDLLDLLGKLG